MPPPMMAIDLPVCSDLPAGMTTSLQSACCTTRYSARMGQRPRQVQTPAHPHPSLRRRRGDPRRTASTLADRSLCPPDPSPAPGLQPVRDREKARAGPRDLLRAGDHLARRPQAPWRDPCLAARRWSESGLTHGGAADSRCLHLVPDGAFAGPVGDFLTPGAGQRVGPRAPRKPGPPRLPARRTSCWRSSAWLPSA